MSLALLSLLALSAVVQEVPVEEIPLTGKLSEEGAEISGMAWHGDDLIFLPQFAVRVLYTLPKREIIAAIDLQEKPALTPREVPFTHLDLPNRIFGFDGYEAITIMGDRVYLLIEANVLCDMSSYIVSGTFGEDGSIRLDPEHHVRLDLVSPLCNFSAESIVPLADGNLLVLPEVWRGNGEELGQGLRLNPSLQEAGRVTLPPVPYRVTDATAAASDGTFWVANYFWPGDEAKLRVEGEEDETLLLPDASSHRKLPHRERLVKMRYDGTSVTRDGAILWLELEEAEGRNWEALVRLDERGFLVMTDEHPRSIFGFSPDIVPAVPEA